jgi:two-component system chemotaxis sensor kinase CheA
VETARVPRDQISPIGAARAFVLHDRTVPLIELGSSLGEVSRLPSPAAANIVVVSVNGHVGGVEVDRFGRRMEVMLKPLDGLLIGMPGIAGTTLLGDGRVLLVLDMQGLLQ